VNCREFVGISSAWLDGELDARRRAAADAHLAGCPDCSRLAADLAAADSALKTVPATERPEADWSDFNRRLMVRVAMDGRRQLRRRSGLLRRLLGRSLRIAVAAALLLAAAWAGFALRGPGKPREANGIARRPAPPMPPPPEAPVPHMGKAGPAGTEDLPVVWIDPASGAAEEFSAAGAGRADEELSSLLAAAEKVLLRLKNADLNDREELSAIRSLVIDSGLVGRLAEARGQSRGDATALAAARSVEMLLLRLSNGSPSEAEEFRDIRNLVLDSAMVERARSARSAM
jgi:hypothetical protein